MAKKKYNIRSLTLIASLAALSAILMQIKITPPFTLPFMKLDVSDTPAMFAGFFLSPMAGAAVVIVKNLLNLIVDGTDTKFVGEFVNIIMGLSYVFPASFIYRRRKNIKTAILGLSIGTISASSFAIALNWFISFPVYSKAYGFPISAILDMGKTINPLVNDWFSLMLFSVFPFNLLKFICSSILTFIIYKTAGKFLRSLIRLPAGQD